MRTYEGNRRRNGLALITFSTIRGDAPGALMSFIQPNDLTAVLGFRIPERSRWDEHMKTVADYLLRIAQFVLSIQSHIEGREVQIRKRASDYLNFIADTLDTIIGGLEAGDEPLSACTQLNTMMYGFPAFIRTFDRSETGKTLAGIISAAHDSPASALIWLRDTKRLVQPCDHLFIDFVDRTPGQLDEELVKLKTAAGAFRAVAANVAVGLENIGLLDTPGKKTSTGKRYITLACLALLLTTITLYYVAHTLHAKPEVATPNSQPRASQI